MTRTNMDETKIGRLGTGARFSSQRKDKRCKHTLANDGEEARGRPQLPRSRRTHAGRQIRGGARLL